MNLYRDARSTANNMYLTPLMLALQLYLMSIYKILPKFCDFFTGDLLIPFFSMVVISPK